ncbi:FadR/GntR family transcriptional regulator [Pleomorphochaeta sp. DL1XJH-081]|jgi:GntR family transcriptional repressor for pyruvate dehydrogenase complex|uniref:FadR/GntR family transcriptional regulator n=1 Tax=Pleomorphochaeta sp. DL1XJH-081 TaxID=3409690 RepID=UPI003BB75B58
MDSEMVDQLKKIEIPHVSDLIIKRVYDLLLDGTLKPGDQLPSEAHLQKALGVAKQQLKIAFNKLELYGVLETRPQAGTFVADINTRILVGLIDNILNIGDGFDPLSLADTRTTLEVRAAELAAQRIDDAELSQIVKANEIFFERSQKTFRVIEDDIFFHQEIVKYSKSPTLIALYSFLTRPLIEVWKRMDLFDLDRTHDRLEKTFEEHTRILEGLRERDPKASSIAMRAHLDSVYKETELLSEIVSKND